MENEFKNKRILVTGGTGSIGSTIVKHLLKFDPLQVRVLSRDETKQYNLLRELNNDPRLSLLIGDVRDRERVNLAMESVDIVFHAAAMKHVLACEHDPFEAVKTNVLGIQNVIDTAMSNGVDKVIGISTDKATDPVSVMGCTKLLAERIMLASYHYKGKKRTKCCFVRFGNVLATRGSVLPLFYQQIKNGGPVTVTDDRMIRFFMSVEEAVGLVFQATAMMNDREIFILKMPVMRIHDLAQAMIELWAPQFGLDPATIRIAIIGRKNGERLEEKLLTVDEAIYAEEKEKMFVIKPVIGSELYTSQASAADFALAKTGEVKEYSTVGRVPLSIPEIKERLKQSEQRLMKMWQLY